MARSRSRNSRPPQQSKKQILGVPALQATREIEELYGRAKKLRVIVEHRSYSNLAFVQITPRDLFVDFIEAPGEPQKDEFVVRVSRVYMPHAAARNLGEVIGNLLEKLKKSGGTEKPE